MISYDKTPEAVIAAVLHLESGPVAIRDCQPIKPATPPRLAAAQVDNA